MATRLLAPLASLVSGMRMWTAKIQQAKVHLASLQAQVSTFFAGRPYGVAVRVDPSTRRLIYFVQKAEMPPELIALLAGDVIQNLRSSLDQLAYQLFTKNSGFAASARHVYFPIGNDLADYQARRRRHTAGLAASAQAVIDSVQPYKGGNDVLWQLHELNIIDKHRTLITAGSAFQSVDLGAHIVNNMRESRPGVAIPSISFFVRPADILFPLPAGSELFIDAPDAKPNPDMQFRFNLVLNESGIVEGKPLIESLQAMVDAIESLQPAFEPELA